MRVVLLSQHLRLDGTQLEKLDGLALFHCFEDFTVGPLDGWPDPAAFTQTRAAFWDRTAAFDLPDGTKLDYALWMSFLPWVDMDRFMRLSPEDRPDIREPYDFEKVVPQSEAIEIWAGPRARDEVLLWFLMAQLPRLGLDMDRVGICDCPQEFFDESKGSKALAMLTKDPDRVIPPRPCPPVERQRMQRLWDAVRAMPEAVDADLRLTAAEQNIFDILRGRHPDPQTGLTRPEARLLGNTTTEWRKMARVIGNAMGMGFDDGDWIGDGVLKAMLEDLARRQPPLIEIEGKGAMRHCQVRLTPAGKDRAAGLPGLWDV